MSRIVERVGWVRATSLLAGRKSPPRLGGPTGGGPTGFTLVEMLVAMAITLVMMAAVVTLFANVSNSVRNRRATIEMTGQIRQVRNVLQQDLQGATCPGLTWQRPESNLGYIELIEGPYREGPYREVYSSRLVDGIDVPNTPDFNPEIDHALSIIPSSNLLPFRDATGTVQPTWVTDGGGLGDDDDILMLTTRNEHEPFVGRVPQLPDPNTNRPSNFGDWGYDTIESPLAEVIWYAVENPVDSEDPGNFFGEPGMRTIYRRALLIAPWVNPYAAVDIDGDGIVQLQGGKKIRVKPGLVRVLPDQFKPDSFLEVQGALVSFQDKYDLSVRLEFDHDMGLWTIVANTLSDLTKRENRYLHHEFRQFPIQNQRGGCMYPYAVTSIGYDLHGVDMLLMWDVEDGSSVPGPAVVEANLDTQDKKDKSVISYTIKDMGTGYPTRPFVCVKDECGTPATAYAMLNDAGQVVRVSLSPMPLWGPRKGEDVMLTNALAFDVRVYDPGCPLFGVRDDLSNSQSNIGTVLQPSDPGWSTAYMDPTDNMDNPNTNNATSRIGKNNRKYPFVAQGAYVDMGYGFKKPLPGFFSASSAYPWFFAPRALSDVYLDSRAAASELENYSYLAPGYCVYDTWSLHYENNGMNEDQMRWDGSNWVQVDTTIDEGTNGLEDNGNYSDAYGVMRLGVDDAGERETAPPYDKPLRGVQVILRAYERDSRAIKQVRVNQHFMPE